MGGGGAMLAGMASQFLVPDRDQVFVTSYRELLGEDHPVWTVIEVVEGLDLSGVFDRYAPDRGKGGRPAYHPAMLLGVLLFGYCEGKRSSRELEEACRRDVAYQAICGGMRPDHATLARFRVLLDPVMESLFTQVVAACVARGLVVTDRVAIDGTRLGAAASLEANVTAGRLAEIAAGVRQVLAEADAADRDDPAVSGVDLDSGNDTEGGGGWSGVRRRLETERTLERVEHAGREVEAAAARRAHDVKRRGRHRPGEPKANLTDPESRVQRTRQGFIQGYNGQMVVSGDQVVIAAEVTPEPTDVGMLGPMLAAAVGVLERAGADPIQRVVADAGYWSAANVGLEDEYGVELLIATGKSDTVGTVDDIEEATASAAAMARYLMQQRLAVDDNQEAYRARSWLVEGTFANVKEHRRSGRLLRRGRNACDAEWKLIGMGLNLSKIITYTRRAGPAGPPTPDTATCRRLHRGSHRIITPIGHRRHRQQRRHARHHR